MKTLRECHHFPDDLIINMDETPIFFDMHRPSTINKKGAREVRVQGTKGGKKRVTFVVGCSASGCMLKPMVIVKGKTDRMIRKLKYSKNEVCIVPQEKAWMDHVVMKVWIKEVLIKYTKRKHCLLVFDPFRAHLTDDVAIALRTANATTVVIPGGCTSKIQPVDVSLNLPIKDIARGQFEEYLMQATSECSTSCTPAPTTADIVQWIVKANTTLNTNNGSIKKAFKVCGISNNLDGSENHLIRCAKELPEFCIPYAACSDSESDEDIFDDNSEEDNTESDEEDGAESSEESIDGNLD